MRFPNLFRPIDLVVCAVLGHLWSGWGPFGYPARSRCLRCGRRYRRDQ